MAWSEVQRSLNLTAVSSGAHGRDFVSGASGKTFDSCSPINGELLGRIVAASAEDYEKVMTGALETFATWRRVPAPERGQVVRKIGNALREHKAPLGALVTAEVGKISAEGEGEIQEAIDIADFAVGLSRQLYGKTMHSERPMHRMYEQWHPLGVVGCITAFNFPAAVWAWNAMIAAVCGDVVVWKPSELAPLTAVAMHKICDKIATEAGFPGLFSLVMSAGPELGERLAADRRVPLVSATGSCRMGRAVGEVVARRLGRTILELGGNNAVIVLQDADLDMAVRSTVFGAVGTAGQRCTTTRRILVEAAVADKFTERLAAAYRQVKIGDPRESGVLMGPLINSRAVEAYGAAINAAKAQGGTIVCGGGVVSGAPSPLYVEPTIIKARADMPIVCEETFAPILYVIPIKDIDEAIAHQNNVPQGLSSAIFTRDLRKAEVFLSAAGSDCGIANVNIGTSGAEIGGAFGGEKDTGGGRESGSDSWKQYMRRQTNTINFGTTLPLAQGIKFDVG
ncbi:MAG: Succinate-semialdehyde dehydrogenase GabD [Pseudomonadota bacterium]